MVVYKFALEESDDISMPLLTVREVSELLHIHQNTLRRWNDQGLIRSIRLGPRGDRRFRREDIINVMFERTHE